MMGHICESVINKAGEYDKIVYAYVKELSRSAVIGIESPNIYYDVKAFLMKERIVHENNSRRIIWLPELEGTIKQLFRA
jgi:hypothetical protein